MKLNTTTIIGIALIGWFLLKPQRPFREPYQNIPPAPPTGTPEWELWIEGVGEEAFSIDDLFTEGAPFFNQDREQVVSLLNAINDRRNAILNSTGLPYAG